MTIFSTYNPISGVAPGTQVTASSNIADEAIVRGDGGAKGVQDSLVFINNTGQVTGVTRIDVDNLRLDGNVISATNVNGDVVLTPNGSGVVTVSTEIDIDNINIDANTISTTNVNGDLNLIPNGSGTVNIPELVLTTDLAVTHGGTGASTAVQARANLGVAIGSDVQAWDVDLDALAALGTTGMMARTAAATYVMRTITQPASGISITNGDGVAGNPTLALVNDLLSLENLAGTGIAARTAGDAWTTRTITGTASRLSVADGDGVAGEPTIDIDAAYVGQASITTLGTITTGVWTGTDIAVADGGSGRGTATAYAVLCGGTTATAAHQSIASVGTAGQLLTSNGAALPTFQDAGGGGAWSLISTQTASNDATIVFTDLTSANFAYVFVIENLAPATDDVDLRVRTSTDNGVGYDAGASDYAYSVNVTTSGVTDSTASSIILTGSIIGSEFGMGNASNEIGAFVIWLINPSSTNYTMLSAHGFYVDAGGTRENIVGGGMRKSAADVDAIQFSMDSGNISTGTFKLYGVTAS